MKKINLQSHTRGLFREQGLLDHLPTFEEWTKDMSLVDQIKFYYDVDIDNDLGDPWEILAECAVDPHWLKEFKVNFKEYLQERDYIR
jgi:hypothetical protein